MNSTNHTPSCKSFKEARWIRNCLHGEVERWERGKGIFFVYHIDHFLCDYKSDNVTDENRKFIDECMGKWAFIAKFQTHLRLIWVFTLMQVVRSEACGIKKRHAD